MTASNEAATNAAAHDRVVSYPELKPNWGIRFSRVHLDRLERAGRFPRRLSLGRGTVGWLASELAAYLANHAAAREVQS